MPPVVALLLTLGFCSFMLWREHRRQPERSAALWLPVVWIFLIASRFVGQWLGLLGITGGGQVAMEDGSPIDAVVFLLLIASGIAVLARRGITLGQFARDNAWLTVFLAYCFLAILWSDFPFLAFKRWIKILGHPVMALVILTDGNAQAAVRTVLKRCAFALMPLSILFIKYYPQYGRYFDPWTGAAGNRGVSLNKNELGYGCMIFALFFAWNLMSARRLEQYSDRREEYVISGMLLAMILWLFRMADSATSLVCTVIGVSTMVAVALPLVSKRFIGTYVVTGALVAIGLETALGVYAAVVQMLGRDPTLTDRTEIWADLFTIPINPVLGAGFESFWLGWRLQWMWDKWWWHPNQAHNGYIETYLNLGWVGVAILIATIVATFRKSRRELLRNLDFGRFRFGFLFVIVAYNYTEAAFKGVHLVWTMFHLIAIDYSARHALSEAAHAVAAVNVRQAGAVQTVAIPQPHPYLPRRLSQRFGESRPPLAPPSRTRTWNWR